MFKDIGVYYIASVFGESAKFQTKWHKKLQKIEIILNNYLMLANKNCHSVDIIKERMVLTKAIILLLDCFNEINSVFASIKLKKDF